MVALILACAIAVLAAGAPAQARYASIVIDFESGQVLHETNADTRNYPASLTKMMTLYMAFEALETGALKLDQMLDVSARAAGMPSSKLGLRKGEKISVKDVILALVTKSANDAAVVMAEALEEKEYKFARRMTTKARELGMSKTTFRNASGLPNRGQVSTARDMATLARALIKDYPGYYELFSIPKFTYRGQTHSNHNRLLRNYQGTDGIKTGYIRASGFNLVASAVRNGRRVVAVVFGGKTPRSRDQHIAKLMDTAFSDLTTIAIAKSPPMPMPKPAQAVASVAMATEDAVSAAVVPEPMETAAAAIEATEPVMVGEGDIAETDAIDAVMTSLVWGVQVGAFYQHDSAVRAALIAADRAPQQLGDARVLVTDIKGQKRRIYRARLIGLSETGARDACNSLKAAKIDCLVVQVDETTAFQSTRKRVATN